MSKPSLLNTYYTQISVLNLYLVTSSTASYPTETYDVLDTIISDTFRSIIKIRDGIEKGRIRPSAKTYERLEALTQDFGKYLYAGVMIKVNGVFKQMKPQLPLPPFPVRLHSLNPLLTRMSELHDAMKAILRVPSPKRVYRSASE